MVETNTDAWPNVSIEFARFVCTECDHIIACSGAQVVIGDYRPTFCTICGSDDGLYRLENRSIGADVKAAYEFDELEEEH